MDIITNGETNYVFFEDDHYDERDDWESEEYYESDPPDEDDYNSDDFKKYCILELNKSGLYACKRAITDLKHSFTERGIKRSKIIDKWFEIYASKLYAAWMVDNCTINSDRKNFDRVLNCLKMDIESGFE